MGLSEKSSCVFAQIKPETTKLGDLRKLGKEINKDHAV